MHTFSRGAFAAVLLAIIALPASRSSAQVGRLPIDPSDLALLATLAPGVVGIEATDSTASAFSVAGLRPDANSVTLDGLTFGSPTVPQDAVRNTRVITSSYDVAR